MALKYLSLSVLSVERNVNGTLLQEAMCDLCNEKDPAFSSPDIKGNR